MITEKQRAQIAEECAAVLVREVRKFEQQVAVVLAEARANHAENELGAYARIAALEHKISLLEQRVLAAAGPRLVG